MNTFTVTAGLRHNGAMHDWGHVTATITITTTTAAALFHVHVRQQHRHCDTETAAYQRPLARGTPGDDPTGRRGRLAFYYVHGVSPLACCALIVALSREAVFQVADTESNQRFQLRTGIVVERERLSPLERTNMRISGANRPFEGVAMRAFLRGPLGQ